MNITKLIDELTKARDRGKVDGDVYVQLGAGLFSIRSLGIVISRNPHVVLHIRNGDRS